MAVPGSLKDLEEKAAGGNSEDGLNPGQRLNDDRFNKKTSSGSDTEQDFNKTLDDNDYTKNTSDTKVLGGDTVARNYNADAENDRKNLEDNENNPDSLYKQADQNGSKNGFGGRIQKMFGKFGPSGGVVAILLFGIIGLGGGSTFLASSLLINIKEMFHNDRADATRTNQLFSRGFMASKYSSNSNKCDAAKPICRTMTQMGAEELKQRERENFRIVGRVVGPDGKETGARTGNVDKDGKPYPTLLLDGQSVIVDEIVYPDGTTTKSGEEYFNHADNNPNALRRSENAFNSRSAFYLNAFFSEYLSTKFKFSKGAEKFPAPDDENDDPNNQQSDENNQDKAFNEEADTVHVDPETGATDPNSPLRGRSEEVINNANTKANSTKDKLAAKGGALGSILQGTCTIYRLAYLAEAAIKTYHTYQLVRFALLFFQAADQIKDGKGDQDRVTYLSNNLTWYDKSAKNDEGGKNPKYNLTATDSEGYQIAAHGDKNGLKEFSQRFLLGGNIGQKIAGFTGAFENSVDKVPLPGDNGHEKMRNLCRAAQSPVALVGTACVALVPALTAGGTAVAPGPGSLAGFALSAAGCACTATSVLPLLDKLPDSIAYALPGIGQCRQLEDGAREAMNQLMKVAQSETVQKWVFEVLRDIHVDDNTKGVDAGNTIAAGAGLMLSIAGNGYGLRPAKNKEEVASYTAFNNDLEQTYANLDKDSARLNPFDPDNQYSLVGSIVRSLKSDNYAAAQSSPYGLFSTLGGLYRNSLKTLTGTPTAEALYHQPSLLGRADERLNYCDSSALKFIGAIGDTYCSTVGVMTTQELTDARDLAYNPNSRVLTDLITYMTTDQPADEAGGGTYCDQSLIVEGLNLESDSTSSCGDKSKQRSIQDDGTPVEGSQYAMYLKYCTEKREASWGDQFEDYVEGSQRDQDWYSGKQCLSDSKMLRSFRMWTNYCLQAGTVNSTLNCYKNTVQATAAVTGKGDACSVMNNPNVILINPGTKEGLKELCENGTATNYCGEQFTVNPLLFDVITANSKKYKIWLNNFGFMKDRSGRCSGQHPLGNAIDINGIEKLDGSGRAGGPDWGGITYGDPKQVKIIADYASDWLAFIPHDRGGVGQKGCSSSFNPVFPPGSTNLNGSHFFADSCDHLHIDIRNRANVNAQ